MFNIFEQDSDKDVWDRHVNSEAFDRDCEKQFKHKYAITSQSDEYIERWDDDSPSSLNWTDTSHHAVSKLEHHFYYQDIRGRGTVGPKLIYRTSTDILSPPCGPFQSIRETQLITVHKHAKLSQNNLWATIRDETAILLDKKKMKWTSIDLVRFRWQDPIDDGLAVSEAIRSRVTIWIGVLPESTNGDAAFDSAQDILELLKRYDIDDIDIAYRESEAQPLHGPVLYAPVDPVDKDNPLKTIIDSFTTALSLPITGLKTPHMRGMLGFYFKNNGNLYGVTARHVLFPDTQGNDAYSYDPSAPKKNVVLMDNKAFNDFLVFLQSEIGSLNAEVARTKESIKCSKQQAGAVREELQRKLDDTRKEISELKKFFVALKTEWSDIRKRVIGHVVWSPPISGLNPPHGYTLDVCVIELDKEKFSPNWIGNTIDLGTQITHSLSGVIREPHCMGPSRFHYPMIDRLYQLQNILPANKITEPNDKEKGDPTRFVIKRGRTTAATLGRLNGFESRQRRYGLFGNFDSIEMAVFRCDRWSDSFAQGGDSGAVIAGDRNDFVAQLTGGTGLEDDFDIIYGTPMEWLWNDVIKAQFPDAVLFDPSDNQLVPWLGNWHGEVF